jgi:uncharacterized repeat protein (TIGR01451 family)
MLRGFGRVSVVLGLTMLILILAGSALTAPTARSSAVQPIGAGMQPRAASIAPSFTVALSAVIPSGLSQPTGIANAGDGSGRLFVLERAGSIRVIRNGALLSTPYLAINSKVQSSNNGEQGLLGLEFDPNFETNGTFYINYTTNASGFNNDTVVARYQVANPNADVANVLTVTHLITIDQPQTNHNGGDLHFGPDGYLYLGMGDGGNGDDVGDGHAPEGNGQAPGTLLGKMLRINVRGVPTYTIPPTNPFTQTAGYRPEIWSLGWRNPWRFSFDRGTGDMYVGDVGQNCWEEISYEPAGSPGGKNYGWRHEEGFRQFVPGGASNCNRPASTLITTTKPITAYSHSFGSAVTGGYVYRGQQYPWMRGVYFYSDSGSGRIWAIQQISPGVWAGSQKIGPSYNVTAFGEDEQGELYVTAYGQGGIYKLTSISPSDFSASLKQVSANTVSTGDRVTYTIVVRNGSGLVTNTVRVTDVIPTGLAYVTGTFTATNGMVDAAGAPTLKWSGVVSPTPIVTLTYAVTVATAESAWLLNRAVIDPGDELLITRTVPIIANPYDLFLPLILRSS